ncbi:MAG: hypothetical protein ACYC99_04140 [Candidatus Geothermincolia bacterium]
MAPHFKSFLGKALFSAWMTRKRLAETRRPGLVKALAVLVALSGAFVIAEGVITGWFLPHVTPYRWNLNFAYGRYPWIKFPQWLAAFFMILVGLMGLYAGLTLSRRKQAGAYFTMAIVAGLLASGGVLLYTGTTFGGTYLTAAGGINLGAGVLLFVVLGLGWYTIDPLGLHWSPTS